MATSGVGLTTGTGAAAPSPPNVAPAPSGVLAAGLASTLSADGVSVRALPEYFVSPLTGGAYRIFKDADTGTKAYCAVGGACYASPTDILQIEGRTLAPWARAVEPSLRARVAAGGNEEINVIIELKDATFSRVASEVWASATEVNAIEARISKGETSPDSTPALADLLALNAATDAARARIYAIAEQDLAPLISTVRGQLESLGGMFMGYTPVLPAIVARMPLSSVPALALEPSVLWISEDRVLTDLLNISAYAIRADTYWNNGFTGGAFDLAVEDTGINATHPGLAPVPQQAAVFAAAGQFSPNYADSPTDPNDRQSHGTHVAGITASNDATYRGVAWGMQKLINVKAGWLTTGGGGQMDEGDGMLGGDWAFRTAGADVLSLSFGGNGAADSAFARYYDGAVDGLGVAVAIAAGNSGPGPGTVTDPGEAYNILTVGAMNDQRTRTRTDDGIAGFSSRGPTVDGRLKPDIVAPGQGIVSSYAFWQTTGPTWIAFSGTSMATPHISATYILSMDGLGRTLPLLHKALLLNSATDWGTPGGDTTYGWGYVDMQKAFTTRWNVTDGNINPSSYLFYKGAVGTGDRTTLVWNRHVTYNGGSAPTVYYGLNDLDLYAYNEADGTRTGTSNSALNNVEQVVAPGNAASVVFKVDAPGTFNGVAQEHYGLACTRNCTPVGPPSLSQTLSVPATVNLGATFTVYSNVTDSGPLAAQNVQLTLNLPAGLTIVGGGNPQSAGRVAAGATNPVSWQVHADTIGTFAISSSASSTSYDEVYTAAAGPQSVRVIDSIPPTSYVVALPANTTTASFPVTANASDNGVVAFVQLWYRKDGGAWTNYGSDSSAPYSWTFNTAGTGGDGFYEFYSIAGDTASNIEAPPAVPDTSTRVDTTPPLSRVDALPQYTTTPTFTVSATASDSGVGVGSVTLFYRRAGAAFWTSLGPDTAPPWSWSFNSTPAGGDGQYEFRALATDLFGNVESKAQNPEAGTMVDTTPPTTTDMLTGTSGRDGWFTSPVIVSLNGGDTLSGLNATLYRVDGGAWQTYTAGFQIPTEGSHTVDFYSTDIAGNTEPTHRVSIKIDTQAPATTDSVVGILGTNGWYRSWVNVTLAATDGVSGVNWTMVQIDSAAPTPYTGTFEVAGEGGHTVGYWSQDIAGNTEPSHRLDIQIDTQAPATTSNPTGSLGGGGWYLGTVSVALTASDGTGSGVAATLYRVDGGAWQTYSAAFPVSGDGTHTVEYYSADRAGNNETSGSVTFKVDATPPATGFANPGNGAVVRNSSVAVTWTASDAGSGVAGCNVSLDGFAKVPLAAGTLSYRFDGVTDGAHTLHLTCTDVAGNVAPRKDLAFSVDTSVATSNPLSTLLALFTTPPYLGLILVILAVVAIAIIAFAAGRRRRKEEEKRKAAKAARAARAPPPPPEEPELTTLPPPPPADEFSPPPPPTD